MEKILVVEDDPTMRKALFMILKAEHYKVEEAENGEEVLRVFVRNGFDLIITDLFLNEITGLDIFRFFRNLIPVLIITGFTDDPLAKKARQIAKDSYLEKPFSPEVLKDKVSLLLTQKEGA